MRPLTVIQRQYFQASNKWFSDLPANTVFFNYNYGIIELAWNRKLPKWQPLSAHKPQEIERAQM